MELFVLNQYASGDLWSHDTSNWERSSAKGRCRMATTIRTDEVSDDLFGDPPETRRRDSLRPNQAPSELKAARALCRELRRHESRHEKQRITHLICLNLITMLRHGPGR